jgi:hypothetical protein
MTQQSDFQRIEQLEMIYLAEPPILANKLQNHVF